MFALSQPSLIALGVLSSMALADSYPVVLTAMSPTLQYLPDIIRWNTTSNITGVWNQTYTDVQGQLDGLGRPPEYIPEHGIVGSGDQVVWAPGGTGDNAACLNYSFIGTGIRFRGFWNAPSLPGSADASVELVIDGGNSTTVNGQQGEVRELVTLAESTELEKGHHNAQLFVRSGNVSIVFVEPVMYFANVPFSTIVQAEATAKQQASTDAEAQGDVDTTPSIIYGTKRVNSTALEVNPQFQVNPESWVAIPNLVTALYAHAGSNWLDAPFTVDLGSGSFMVRINGTLQPRNDAYKIEVIPAPPGRDGIFRSNAFAAPWAGNGTIYLAALDPGQSYSLTVENTPPGIIDPGRWTTVHSIELWKGNATGDTAPAGQGNGTDSSSGKDGGGGTKSNKTGAIAGGVVGGVVGLALIGIICYFLGRKASRKNGTHNGPKETDFEIEDHTATSYQPEASAALTAFPPKMSQSPLESPSQYPAYTKLTSVQAGAMGPYETSESSSDLTPSSQPPSKSKRSTLLSSMAGPALGTAPSSTTGSAPHQRSERPESIVDQEEDAGALVPHSFEEAPRRIVPPRYNPAWAAPSVRTDVDTQSSQYPESAVSPSSRTQDHTW